MTYNVTFNGKTYKIKTSQATKTVTVGEGKKAKQEEVCIPDEINVEITEENNGN